MPGSEQCVPGWNEAAVYNRVHAAMRGRVRVHGWSPDRRQLLPSPAPGPVWKLVTDKLPGKIPRGGAVAAESTIAWQGCPTEAGKEGGCPRHGRQSRAGLLGLADPLTALSLFLEHMPCGTVMPTCPGQQLPEDSFTLRSQVLTLRVRTSVSIKSPLRAAQNSLKAHPPVVVLLAPGGDLSLLLNYSFLSLLSSFTLFTTIYPATGHVP